MLKKRRPVKAVSQDIIFLPFLQNTVDLVGELSTCWYSQQMILPSCQCMVPFSAFSFEEQQFLHFYKPGL